MNLQEIGWVRVVQKVKVPETIEEILTILKGA